MLKDLGPIFRLSLAVVLSDLFNVCLYEHVIRVIMNCKVEYMIQFELQAKVCFELLICHIYLAQNDP